MTPNTKGLLKRGKVWHIHKTILGQRIRQSTGCEKLKDAERVLHGVTQSVIDGRVYGRGTRKTFEESVEHYFRVVDKRSIVDDGYSVKRIKPFIGNLYLDEIDMAALQRFISDMRTKGMKTRTINCSLQIVRRIINLAHDQWKDKFGNPWLLRKEKITLLKETDARKPDPLSWEQQDAIFDLLPEHMRLMALFKVNTGTRESEVCNLRWEWLKTLPDIGIHVFHIPREQVKNGEPRTVILNRTARTVILRVRGQHPTHVFTYMGRPLSKMNTSAWKRACNTVLGRNYGIHGLKHTLGYRLLNAGVQFEDRQFLLGHTKGKAVTNHYCDFDARRMVEIMESIERARPLLKVVGND